MTKISRKLDTAKLETFTLQRLFDYMVARLAEQGRPSKHGPKCLYRGPHAQRCAIGWLIPDTDYLPEFEGRSVFKLPLGYLKPFETFLDRMQLAHDESRNISEFKYKLRYIANGYGIKPAMVDTITRWEVG